MQENNFNTTVQSLFKGMDSFITTKTVIGDAVHIGDTIILPLDFLLVNLFTKSGTMSRILVMLS